MRLFIAINFRHDTRGQLLALRDALRRQSAQGHFSQPENLHLTLAFLGECDGSQIAAARAALAATRFAPFDIAVDCVGSYRRETGNIWWAGLGASEPLIRLQHDLVGHLTAAGFAPERRNYRPHITLGREVVTDAVPWAIPPFGETVGAIELMKSERIAGKLTYTAIARQAAQPS